jgi:pimeloyl-ACP methyl ester carboxylesterase
LTINHPNPDAFFSSLKFSKLHVITEEMMKGRRPAFLQKKILSSSSELSTTASLILVHGYCATSNPWSAYSSNFDKNAAYFLNANSNASNDEFARLIAQFASAQNLASYSCAGYSQGGMAIVHLRNYYWSGLDVPQNKSARLLQSVATPYLGNSAAGSISSLGTVFGVGCGANYDLTKDGSNLWGAGISTETRENLFYYYVTYKNVILSAYCNGATNLVLDHPNDGVVEEDATHFASANNCGVKVGWCHKAGMLYPPAFSDQNRNVEINADYARN